VPLWCDAGTLQDISAWKQVRIAMGATAGDPLICSVRTGTFGDRLTHGLVWGDILLADRYYCSYFMICLLKRRWGYR
jgi:hypothetical protein